MYTCMYVYHVYMGGCDSHLVLVGGGAAVADVVRLIPSCGNIHPELLELPEHRREKLVRTPQGLGHGVPSSDRRLWSVAEGSPHRKPAVVLSSEEAGRRDEAGHPKHTRKRAPRVRTRPREPGGQRQSTRSHGGAEGDLCTQRGRPVRES
jgi:hypothetical protein